MIGIVVVSHSRALAEAAVALAAGMMPGRDAPVAIAAGTPDGGFGTDAMAISEAIDSVSDGDGVVVLTDLGSAILSSEMAIEFLPDPNLDVRIVPAPFVEGLLAATVASLTGAGMDEVVASARGALQPKLEQLGGANPDAPSGNSPDGPPAPAEVGPAPAATAEVRIPNTNGLHARPAAVIAREMSRFDAEVTIRHGVRESAARSTLGVAALGTRGGDVVELSATGPDRERAVEALSALIRGGFGELDGKQAHTASSTTEGTGRSAEAAVDRASTAAARSGGVGVSAGRVVGTAVRMPDPIPQPDLTARVEDGGDGLDAARAREVDRLRNATSAVTAHLEARAKRTSGEASEVLRATAAMVADPEILARATDQITSKGVTAVAAAWETLEGMAVQFAHAGGLQAERVRDVRDVRDRIAAELLGLPMPGVPDRDEPFILVAEDLAPADTATLSPSTCLGIATRSGGPTSHTAILARSLGIPAVVAAPAAATIREGDVVLIDGTTGEIQIAPDDSSRRGARSTPERRASHSGPRHPGRTRDGHAVQLLANVGGVNDVRCGVEQGAEGVGLFRTEFQFLGRTEAPSLEEQRESYRAVFAACGHRKIVVRTLDAGSDKPLPFVTTADEENPALGVRGYRTATIAPDVLHTQLQAIADAATAETADVWVMAPMISTPGEARAFAELARSLGLAKVGVMVETPSAALLTGALFNSVDFVSLGTNDLAQYTMAADRQAGPLASLNDPWQPAVLRLIREVGMQASGRPVGVCGEAGADPLLAPVLVGLGVNSLSMTPAALDGVRDALARVPFDECRAAAAAACAATSPEDARAAVRAVLAEH